MKLYKETHSMRFFGTSEMYVFDFDCEHVIDIGKGQRGHKNKNLLINQHIPYNIEQYPDYTLKQIEFEEFPMELAEDLIDLIFGDNMDRALEGSNTREVPEYENNRKKI